MPPFRIPKPVGSIGLRFMSHYRYCSRVVWCFLGFLDTPAVQSVLILLRIVLLLSLDSIVRQRQFPVGV